MPIFKRKKKKLGFDKELAKWLGSKLVKEGNRLLNNSPSKEELIKRFLIAKRNWELALGEVKKLEVELKITQRGME